MSSDLEQPSRFVVGIDLGTTNSALAAVDTDILPWCVADFVVPQLVAPGVVEPRDTLPSFHYERGAAEFSPADFRLPWSEGEPQSAVGFFARDHGTLVPGRMISSAKSWLCHPSVDRTADLLPWHGAADVERISPVEASARYLAHLRAAWNHRYPEHPLESQDVVLTLPASFDEVARELTIKAAARAGLPRVVLIEEPQAAFYAWIHAAGDDWERTVSPGQKILVCDLGGGTCDFTLIQAGGGADGKVRFQRVAVGEHLILGGDNMDLALAHHLEPRLAGGGRLEPRQWSVLVRVCRQVKETLLSDLAPEQMAVHLPSAGARLIGAGLQTEVTRQEVSELLVDGFLPRVPLDAKPQSRRSGFQEFGLPYAADAAITRYMAAFLSAHRRAAPDRDSAAENHDPARPDIVLFNGGVFASDAMRARFLDVLGSWFSDVNLPEWRPLVLANDRLDLAVARGAAYYGMVRRGQGVRIAAGLARSYYIGVETDRAEAAAVCLAPAGVEEGQTVDLNQRRFELRIRQPVEFPLYVSSTRLTDQPGAAVAVNPEELTALPPIRTVLQSGRKTAAADTISVQLHARPTEIGTLDLWCGELDGPRTWKLQFDVRAATRTDIAAHQGESERAGIVDEPRTLACRRLIERTFAAPAGRDADKPEGLVKRLAEAAELGRHEWPPSLLRAMWETLCEVEPGRRRSATHEARWLNLLGFALRPGYGFALDDWRVAQTARLLQGKLAHPNAMCRAEWWILWRRMAGGLAAGAQRGLAEPQLADLRAAGKAGAKGRAAEGRPGSHESAELWRLLGSLELLPIPWKIELGHLLLDRLPKEKTAVVRAAGLWAVGRIGARVPLYGPLNAVVPTETAADWAGRILRDESDLETAPLALMQLARRTGDRYRDLSDAVRDNVANWLAHHDAPVHFIQLVQTGGELESNEQGLIFGESLPRGLRLEI